MQQAIQEAITLRSAGQPEQALNILLPLNEKEKNEPHLNYQIAWTYDSMGKEALAAPYYEIALNNGLREDREGAYLGLGSTYRCLGFYEKSLAIFDRAIQEFPNNRALKVFRALTLFNLNRSEESVSEILIQLLDTSADPKIKLYHKALRFYSDKLNQTWT